MWLTIFPFFQGMELSRSVNEAGFALQHEPGSEESENVLRATMKVYCFLYLVCLLMYRFVFSYLGMCAEVNETVPPAIGIALMPPFWQHQNNRLIPFELSYSKCFLESG